MSDHGVIIEEVDGELVDERHLPAVREQSSPTLFGTTDPAAVIEKATEAARPLAQVVRKQGLAVSIQGREHVKVEGWTLLGSMLGVFPICVWTRKLENGWEARVEARTRDGDLVGAAEAECLYTESTWNGRDDFALRSMAQTRATSKALRVPLGFVMHLAGFDATPAEEMTSVAAEVATDEPITDPGAVVLTFGKHRDKPIREVPSEYLAWWLSQEPPKRADQLRQRRAAELFTQGATEGDADQTDDIPF